MRKQTYLLILKLCIAAAVIALLASCQEPKKFNNSTDTQKDSINSVGCEYIGDTTKFKILPRTNSRVAVTNKIAVIDYQLDYTFVQGCGGKDKAIQALKSMFSEVQRIYAKIGIKIALGQVTAFEREADDPYHGTSLETLAMVNACQTSTPIYPGNYMGYIHQGMGGGMSKAISGAYYFACSIPNKFTPFVWSIATECMVHELGHQFGLPHSHELYHPIFDPITGKTYTSQAYDYFGTSLGYNNGALESRDYKPVPLNTPWMYPDSCLVMSYGHLDYKHNPRKTYSFTPWEIALMKQTINSRTDIGTDGVSSCKNDVTNFTYDGTAHWSGLFNSTWDICWGITVPGNTKFNSWQPVAADNGPLKIYPGWAAYKYTNGSAVTSPFTSSTTATVNDGLRFETAVPIALDKYSTLTENTTLPAGTAYASSVWLNGVTKGKTAYGTVGANGVVTIKIIDYGAGLTINRFHIRGDKYTGSKTYSVSSVTLNSTSQPGAPVANFTFPDYPDGTKLTVKIRPTCNDPQTGKENTYYITTKKHESI